MVTMPVRCSIQSTRNWLVSAVWVLILPIMLGAPSLDHVWLLLVQAGLDVVLVPDVEPAVAGAEEELLMGEPPHRTPEVRAGVAQDVELAHDLFALGFRETLALLVQNRRALRFPQNVAGRPLPALLLDRGLPREPDSVIQLVVHVRLLGARMFFLYGPLP